MTRAQVLKEIRTKCEAQYAKIDDSVHNLAHIKRVVREGRRLCKLERMRSKDAFLVELACWLHDLGRVGEESGLALGESNHAEDSYQMSKQILKPYERVLGREPVYNLLQAVREHSLPTLKHPENRIARILQDADRGSGLNVIGIFNVLTYLEITDMPPVNTISSGRSLLEVLTKMLRATNKINEALVALNYLKDWYSGTDDQHTTHRSVSPLHTHAAKRQYKKGIKEIERYMRRLQEIQSADCQITQQPVATIP